MAKIRGIYPEKISDEELRKYDCRSFNGEIVLVDTIIKFDSAMAMLRPERILGFDTETKPNFRKGRKNKVALLQLSTRSKAFLFRLNNIGLPGDLLKLLSDNSIVKAGVAIHDDIRFLQELGQFEPAGFKELQSIAVDNGIKNLSLKKLAAITLGFRVSKKQQVTDWEARTLTDAQLLYAATDAWICYELYMELVEYGSSN